MQFCVNPVRKNSKPFSKIQQRIDNRRGTAELSGFTKLHYACAAKDPTLVLTAMKEGVAIDSPTVYGETALHCGSQCGDSEVVKLLLQNKASLNVLNSDGLTPLHQACQCGHSEVISILLDAGADTGLTNIRGQRPVDMCRTEQCRRKFSERGFTVPTEDAANRSRRSSEFTPLMYSAIKGDVLAVGRLLYESVRDVNKRSVHGDTAMHFVCQSGALQIARRLIEHKADVNIENEDGETPLDMALHMGNEDMVNRLSGDYGIEFLHGKSTEVKALIVDESAAKYDSGYYSAYSPLQYACTSNDELAVREILRRGSVDINAQNAYADAALHFAARSGGVAIVQLLLNQKAEVNAKNDRGQTPIFSAIRRGNPEIIELLVSAGADLNATDFRGVPPQGCWQIWE